MPFHFRKELVDHIRKLMFSLGPAPLADNENRGITMLDFDLMSVGEEDQLREDQEAFYGVASPTPVMMRASRRKCLEIPTTFEQLERLLVWYIKSEYNLFIANCPHFVEVILVNGGHLPASVDILKRWLPAPRVANGESNVLG